jgi:hypothetical protein
VNNLKSPIATYDLPCIFFSGLISGNYLFLGSSEIIIYEISRKLDKPLKKLASIKTKEKINKMIKVGQELFLGEDIGYL